ncbi:MAG: Phenazine biosynthesis protein PhzF like, partial [uncultured Nocardioidaceae bacterium]
EQDLPAGRRLRRRTAGREPGGRRARRRRARRRGDAALRAVDEPVRDDLPAPAEHPGGRLPGPDLHAGRGAPLRRAPDPRQLPRLARDRRRPGRPRGRRAGVRGRTGPDPAYAGGAGLRRSAAGALGAGRRAAAGAPRRGPRGDARCSGRRRLDRQRPWLGVGAARLRRGGARPAPARGRPRRRCRRSPPARFTDGLRGARVLRRRRHRGRGPGDREPQRVGGAVAARVGPRHRAVRRQPGHRPRQAGPGARLPGRRGCLGRRCDDHGARRRGPAL